jgi:hypothetical protein
VTRVGLALILSLPLVATGCAAAMQRQFTTESNRVITECRNERLSGQVRGYVGSVNCSNPRIAQLAAQYRIADSDIVAAFLAKRLEIAERQDAGQLTEGQAKVELTTTLRELDDEELARRGAAQAASAQNFLATAAAINAIQPHYYVPFANRPITCNTSGPTTTCY